MDLYNDIYLGSKDNVFIFVSGNSGVGKTYFSKKLNERIKNSIYFDSDVLTMTKKGHMSLEEANSLFNPNNYNIFIVSDIFASKYFFYCETKDAIAINVLVKPISFEERYKHFCWRDDITYEQFKYLFSEEIELNKDVNPIIVCNDYTDNLDKEVDKTIVEVLKRMNVNINHHVKRKSIFK